MNQSGRVPTFKSHAILVMGGFLILSLSTAVLSEDKPKIAKPSQFKVGYSLKSSGSQGAMGAPGLFSGQSAVASIAVNILDERFYPVKTFVLRDVKTTSRIESLWDGRDTMGKEMPAGNFYASLSIVYSDGSKESKIFRFVKE